MNVLDITVEFLKINIQDALSYMSNKSFTTVQRTDNKKCMCIIKYYISVRK